MDINRGVLGTINMKANGREQIPFELSRGVRGETDPTVPDWAKQDRKPGYRYEEILEVPEEITNMELEELIKNLGGL